MSAKFATYKQRHMIFYFSGAGNSAWVAEKLAAMLDDTLISIADYSDEAFEVKPHERIGFVFPVYSWAPPAIVIKFIKRVKISTPEYLYFVCTCGDDAGKTGEVFAKAVKARGWHCDAGYSVIMPNTYVALPGFDIDDEELQRRKVENAKERVRYIADNLKQNIKMESYDCHIGSIPCFKTYVISPLFNKYQINPEPFHSTEACTSCRRCEKSCPVHNIKIEEGRPIWGKRCTQCLACFHICPVNAIHYGKNTEGKKQYKAEVLLK